MHPLAKPYNPRYLNVAPSPMNAVVKPASRRREFKSNMTADQLKGERNVFAILFGAIFAGIGLLIVGFILQEFLQTLDTYRWQRVPAVVNELTIDFPATAPPSHEDSVFALNADYTYSFGGREYKGTKFTKDGAKPNGSYEKLAILKRNMFIDEVDTAFVDPDAPGNAILQRGSLLFGLLALFPMIFVIIGLGVLASGLGLISSKTSTPKYKPFKPKSRSGKTTAFEKLSGLLFGGAFLAIGCIALWFIALGPWLRSRNAANWQETPCEVIWSRVESHKGDESTTYRPDIFYQYEFDGEEHRSNRYSFVTGSSSGYNAKQKIVKQYPKGRKTICFVNPDVPERAVLSRELKQLGFWWLFPIPFIGVGLTVMVASLGADKKRKHWFQPGSKKSRKSRPSAHSSTKSTSSSSANPFTNEIPQSSNVDEPLVLTSNASRRNAFLGTTFFCLFWNGMVALFLTNVPGIGIGIFMIPFILIGVLMIVGWFYTLFSLMNPKSRIEITPGNLKTGDICSLQWNLAPRSHRVKRLKVYLEGTEQARYRRGTSHVTDNKVFFRKLLVDETDPAYIHQGIVEYELPSGLMPTLDLDDNKILWHIVVRGDVPRWPDVRDKLKFDLLPFDNS